MRQLFPQNDLTSYHDKAFNLKYLIKQMKINLLQEIISFINSIFCIPNLEIKQYILWQDWVNYFMSICVYLPPKQKHFQYHAVVGC